jgi:hypothetical protein
MADTGKAADTGADSSHPLTGEEQKKLQHDIRATAYVLLTLLLAGFAVSGIQAGSYAPAVWLWALACLGVGAVGGFLFAIPRVPRSVAPNRAQPDSQQSTTVSSGEAALPLLPSISDRGFGLGINTNLEEISDWLTKILVGLGLVELRSVPTYLQRAGYFVGQSLGGQQYLAGGVIVYFLGLGFLCGYLLTRMFIGPAFRLADQATSIGITLVAELAKTRADAEADRVDNTIGALVGTAMEELTRDVIPQARIDQLIRLLDGYRSRRPLHRKLNIVLARLYGEGKGDFDNAIGVLQTFIENKNKAGQNDLDVADAYFNMACYYSQMMAGLTNGQLKAAGDDAVKALSNSFKIAPENAKDALTDPDLENLRRAGRLSELKIGN